MKLPPPKEYPNGIRAVAVTIGTSMISSGSDRPLYIIEDGMGHMVLRYKKIIEAVRPVERKGEDNG